MSNQPVHAKEEAFHDDWAAGTKVEQVQVKESFDAPTDRYSRQAH